MTIRGRDDRDANGFGVWYFKTTWAPPARTSCCPVGASPGRRRGRPAGADGLVYDALDLARGRTVTKRSRVVSTISRARSRRDWNRARKRFRRPHMPPSSREPCLVGCDEVKLDLTARTARIGKRVLSEGDLISLDTDSGLVLRAPQPSDRSARPRSSKGSRPGATLTRSRLRQRQREPDRATHAITFATGGCDD